MGYGKQACAQEDLVKALREPPTPSTCGETGIGGGSDEGLLPEEERGQAIRSAMTFDESSSG